MSYPNYSTQIQPMWITVSSMLLRLGFADYAHEIIYTRNHTWKAHRIYTTTSSIPSLIGLAVMQQASHSLLLFSIAQHMYSCCCTNRDRTILVPASSRILISLHFSSYLIQSLPVHNWALLPIPLFLPLSLLVSCLSPVEVNLLLRVLAVSVGGIVARLVHDHLHTFSALALLLRVTRYHVQLAYPILNGEGKGQSSTLRRGKY